MSKNHEEISLEDLTIVNGGKRTQDDGQGDDRHSVYLPVTAEPWMPDYGHRRRNGRRNNPGARD